MTGERRCEVAVVGAGMLGASAARHLADAGCDVVLVGQAEPTDRQTHGGVFGSHHDVARVSRIIDPDPVRAWLGYRSVSQFTEVAARTGIDPVNPVGHLWVDSPVGIDLLAEADVRYGLCCQRRGAAEAIESMEFLMSDDGPMMESR